MNTDIFLNLLQMIVLMSVFVGAIRLIHPEDRPIRLILFAFAAASVLLSNLYWLAYDILRPGTRMPFAANEIAEWAVFLLLGAALKVKQVERTARCVMTGAALFAAASAGLWIAWSGEWVEDILTGVSYGYFICCLTAQMKQEDAFSCREWRLLGIAGLVLIAAQTATFFVPVPAKQILDLFCYILMFTAALLFILKSVFSFREDVRPAKTVCSAFAAFAWAVTVVYMSAGAWYIAALLLSMICYPLMLSALKREVEAV